MTPDFQIIANGIDITAQINDRLIDLSITDEAGLKADDLNLQLDDRDAAIELPENGALLQVFMGYRETGLVFMGAFVYDEITLKWRAETMAIRGQSADMAGAIKEPKTRNWDNVTVKDIITKIAGEHGLATAIDDDKGGFTYKSLAQTNESNLHLITRLAKEHDAMAAIKDSTLLFTAKGAGRSASGQPLPMMTVQPGDVTDAKAVLTSRERYESVSAFYNDKGVAKRVEVVIGDREPVFRIRHTFPSREEAERAAQSKLDALRRGTDALHITMPGNSDIMAETPIEMIGFRDGINGRWSAIRVTHKQNGSGYSTRFEAERPL